MARLNPRSASTDVASTRLSSSPSRNRERSSPTPLSSIASEASDKENRTRSTDTRRNKRKSSEITMSTQHPESSKRRKLGEGGRAKQSQQGKREAIDRAYYDPDQDPRQRRATKKNLRNLMSKLNDSKAEYLQPDSAGLVDTLRQADTLFKDVKQTSDATIDSRMLVTTADLSYKKIRSLTQGDSSVGIDVDDFVSRSILFMKNGAIREASNTQSQHRRRQQIEDEDEDGDNGDAMNWAYLGRNKKVRQQTQRRAREARADPSQALRPTQLGPEDLEKKDSITLTQICTEISALLDRTVEQGTKDLEAEYDSLTQKGEMSLSRQDEKAMMRKYGLTDNGFVPLFDFCVNPKSFGQTVENMFYVSFLVKEGRAGLAFDSEGLPTLGRPEQQGVAEKHEAGVQRNQAIFTLSFEVWEELIQSFGIQKSIIPHRDEDMVYDDGVVDTQALRSQDVDGIPPEQDQEEEAADMYG